MNKNKELMALYPKGSKPPQGYTAWHQWAEAQHQHGLRQTFCPECKLWFFPQEYCKHREDSTK